MYEVSTKDFLYVFYLKLENKLKLLTELNDKKSFYETRSKIIEAIHLLSLNTSSTDLIQTFNKLSLLIMGDKTDINVAIEFCQNSRKEDSK